MNDSPSRSPNRIIQGPLRWLLWAASLAVAVTAPFIEDPAIPAIVHVSCIVFLASMFGFWFGLAPVRPLKRIVNSLGLTTLFGVVFGIGLAFPFWSGGEFLITTLFCWVITLVVGGTTFLLRLFCGQLQLVGESEHVQEALQFKVRDILILTTVVAVILAIGRQLKPIDPGVVFRGVTSLGCIFASVSVMQIWAMLGKNVSWPRVLVMTLALFAAAWFVHQLDDGPYPAFWISITIASQLLVIGSLVCIRRQGYRFVKTGV